MTRSSSLLAGAVWLAIVAGASCGAQQKPVSVTVHLTDRNGKPLRDAAVEIAPDPDRAFAHYRSNSQGSVTIALRPGEHEIRIEVHGYAVTSEHLRVSTAMLIDVPLGHEEKPDRSATVEQPAQGSPTRAMKVSASKHAESTAIVETGATNPVTAYSSCFFPDGLQIELVEPLDPATDAHPLKTAQGIESVPFVKGERVMFAYPFTDYFANVTVEELPADHYSESKQILLDNMHYLESEINGPIPAEALPADLHGFEVHGNNRDKMVGGALGMYLLFDDVHHVATTAYFLNQETWRRKFQTMAEYERLRDRFLTTYTGCVRQNQEIGR